MQSRTELQHSEITEAIIGCAFQVSNELGTGFLESVYEKSLAMLLREKGLSCSSQHPIQVKFRGVVVGEFVADLLVEGKVVVKLKAVKGIAPEHQAQVINYLKATEMDVGLLINFGCPRLEFKRFTRASKSENPD
ncbi:MAG: GxxExxY protein [Pirellulaceae bacterium]